VAIFTDLPDLIGDLITDLNADEGLGFSVTINYAAGGTATAIALEDEFSAQDLAGGLVQGNDKAIAIPAAFLTVAPQPFDTVTDAGTTTTIIRVLTSKPGAAAVTYRLQCRAG
jgi:hypothetical protein